MNLVNKMLYEYVYPTIALSLLLGIFLLIARPGQAIDKGLNFNDGAYSQKGE